MAQPTVTMDTPGVILALAQLFLAAHCSQAAFALPPPGQLGSAFYLQCEDPAEKGDWLSFLGLGLEFFPSADTVARVPYLLVPSGNGTFSLQNLWRGYSEKRFGDFVAIDCVDLTGQDELKAELDELTEGGTRLAAVLNTHPYHSLGIDSFHAAYPAVGR